jgi:hypothetical protein
VAEWFGRFPAATESREDTYLLDPQLPGLSVKIRGGGALEVRRTAGARGSWRWPAGPAAVWNPDRSGPFPVSRSAPAAETRPAGGRYASGGASAGSHRPADRSRHAPRDSASRGARWNSPRSTRAASTGGPSASRRPAPQICSTANSRPPPHSCSPTLCPVMWNPAPTNPDPTPSGCPSAGRLVTPAPEDCPCAESAGPLFCLPRPAPANRWAEWSSTPIGHSEHTLPVIPAGILTSTRTTAAQLRQPDRIQMCA